MFHVVCVHGIVAFVQLFAFVLLLSSVGLFCCKLKKARKVPSCRTNSAESINLQHNQGGGQGAVPAAQVDNSNAPAANPQESKSTPLKRSSESATQQSAAGSVPARAVSITAVSTHTDRKHSVMSTQKTSTSPFESNTSGEAKKNAPAKSDGKQEEPLPTGPFGANPNPSLRKKSMKHRRPKMSRERVENTQESQRRASMVSMGKSCSRRRNSFQAEQEETEDDNTMDGVKSISKDEVPSETQEETFHSTKT